MNEIAANRIRKEFEAAYTQTANMTHCFTHDPNYDYINPVVQMAWLMYLKGRNDANQHINRMLKANNQETIDI